MLIEVQHRGGSDRYVASSWLNRMSHKMSQSEDELFGEGKRWVGSYSSWLAVTVVRTNRNLDEQQHAWLIWKESELKDRH